MALKVLKSRRQYNLFLENNPAFKGSSTYVGPIFAEAILQFSKKKY